MLTKTKVALAAIAMLGAVSAVQAADKEEGVGGFRQGPEGQNLAPTQRSVEPRAQAIEPRAQERTEGRRERFDARTGENPAVERADPTDGDENGKK